MMLVYEKQNDHTLQSREAVCNNHIGTNLSNTYYFHPPIMYTHLYLEIEDSTVTCPPTLSPVPKRVSPLLLLSTPHQRGIRNHPQDWHGYSPQLHPYSSYVWGQTFYEHPVSSTEDHPYHRALGHEHLDLRN